MRQRANNAIEEALVALVDKELNKSLNVNLNQSGIKLEPLALK